MTFVKVAVLLCVFGAMCVKQPQVLMAIGQVIVESIFGFGAKHRTNKEYQYEVQPAEVPVEENSSMK